MLCFIIPKTRKPIFENKKWQLYKTYCESGIAMFYAEHFAASETTDE